jgi:hypothetical protein
MCGSAARVSRKGAVRLIRTTRSHSASPVREGRHPVQDPGVVDQHVQSAERVDAGGDHLVHHRLLAQVTDDAYGATAVVLDLLDGPLGARPVEVRHQDLGTRESELQRGGPSDPGPRPGDDDTAPFKTTAAHGVLLGSQQVRCGHPEVGKVVCPRTRRRTGGVAGDRVRDGADPRPHGFGAGAAFRSRRPRFW